MGLIDRLFGRRVETCEGSWDRLQVLGIPTLTGGLISPAAVEGSSAAYAAVQLIAQTLGATPLYIYKRGSDGVRSVAENHPVQRLFGTAPNDLQTPAEFVTTMQANTLLHGWAVAEIERDGNGMPKALWPVHPGHVAIERIPGSRRIQFQIGDEVGTRRLLPGEVLLIKDRWDDPFTPRSRLDRAREALGGVLACERFAAATWRNGARLSGMVSHPETIGPEAAKTLRETLQSIYGGADNAGKVGVLEEGMTWKETSATPHDAELSEARRLAVVEVARIRAERLAEARAGKTCAHCARPFVAKKAYRIFCSHRCATPASKLRNAQPRSCGWCGSTFPAVKPTSTFCSKSCAARGRASDRRPQFSIAIFHTKEYVGGMRAKELVPLLAEMLGVDPVWADQADRALADAGFRKKGRGRAVPEMSRVEALHFLIACMTSTVAMRAPEDVAYWLAFRGNFYPSHNAEAEDRSLIECLLWAVAKFEADCSPDPLQLKLEITLSHHWVSFEVLQSSGRWAIEIALDHPEEQSGSTPDPLTAIHRSVHVNGLVFLEIAKRTAPPDAIEAREVEHASA